MTNFDKALKVIPGGVDSPVRAWGAVGGNPEFIASASGNKLTTESGKELLDFCLSWGALPLGHAPKVVTDAVSEQLLKGTSYGAPTVLETELAEIIVDSTPSIDQVRFVSSGTEAVMSALRLARGFTGRNKIVKFDGCYHGHSDSLLVNAGSGVAELSGASSAGVPEEFVAHTISIPYNQPELFKKVLLEQGAEIAAVIVEPIPANMGVVLPEEGFLELIREKCTHEGALLIFDEVITGFRINYGGYQNRCKVDADITTFGKIIGGGFPVGAFGASEEIMKQLAPLGPVYQAGTLSGNPIAMRAGIATLSYLRDNQELYTQMEEYVDQFADAFTEKHGTTVNHIGSMFTIFHTKNEVSSFEGAANQNTELFKERFHSWGDRGIYTPPSMYEAFFISEQHTLDDLMSLI